MNFFKLYVSCVSIYETFVELTFNDVMDFEVDIIVVFPIINNSCKSCYVFVNFIRWNIIIFTWYFLIIFAFTFSIPTFKIFGSMIMAAVLIAQNKNITVSIFRNPDIKQCMIPTMSLPGPNNLFEQWILEQNHSLLIRIDGVDAVQNWGPIDFIIKCVTHFLNEVKVFTFAVQKMGVFGLLLVKRGDVS